MWFNPQGFLYEGYSFKGKRVGYAWNIGNEWIYEGMYKNDKWEGYANLLLMDGEQYNGEY